MDPLGGDLLEEVTTWSGLSLPIVSLSPGGFYFLILIECFFSRSGVGYKMDFSGFPLESLLLSHYVRSPGDSGTCLLLVKPEFSSLAAVDIHVCH